MKNQSIRSGTASEADRQLEPISNLRRLNIIAGFWGFAEATFFFIVPDVLLTFLATRHLRTATTAAYCSLAGALIGGTALYILGIDHQEQLNQFLIALPAIDTEMIQTIKSDIHSSPATALTLGPLAGNPYKIYASNFANSTTPYWLFILVSAASRITRFLLVTLAAGLLAKALKPYLKQRTITFLLGGAWLLFYTAYFAVKS